MTRLHINAIILAIILAILQGYILWLLSFSPEANGGLIHHLQEKDLDILAMVFSPMAGIIWTMKHFAGIKPGSKQDTE